MPPRPVAAASASVTARMMRSPGPSGFFAWDAGRTTSTLAAVPGSTITGISVVRAAFLGGLHSVQQGIHRWHLLATDGTVEVVLLERPRLVLGQLAQQVAVHQGAVAAGGLRGSH